jgi:hypothetical protein
MSIDVSQLASSMASAFIIVLKDKAPDIKIYAENEAKKLAHTLVMIEELYLSNKIDQDEVKLHLDIQKNSTRIVFLTIEGLGILAVEQAINAALAVVKESVNEAIGFALL